MSAGFSLCLIANQASAGSRSTTVSTPPQPVQVKSERDKRFGKPSRNFLGERRVPESAVDVTGAGVTIM